MELTPDCVSAASFLMARGSAGHGSCLSQYPTPTVSRSIIRSHAIVPPFLLPRCTASFHYQTATTSARVVQARKKSPPSRAWVRQLPGMVQQLEQQLYQTAPSWDAYRDRTTITARLKVLAGAVAARHQRALGESAARRRPRRCARLPRDGRRLPSPPPIGTAPRELRRVPEEATTTAPREHSTR